jgi:urease accessory protein UreE
MLCDRVLYNLHETPPRDERAEESLPLDWHQLHERALRAVSSAGRTVNLLLPLGAGARDGDVVHEDADRRIVVRVRACDVYVARPGDSRTMGLIAAELGNLHVPLEIVGEELLTPRDGPAAGVFARYGVHVSLQHRIFQPLRSIALNDAVASPGLKVIRRPPQ